MKIYKVRHKPTGLFFKPSKYPNHSNLSKTGKVYHVRPAIEKWLSVYPSGMKYNHPTKKSYPHLEYEVRTTTIGDWEIIEGTI